MATHPVLQTASRPRPRPSRYRLAEDLLALLIAGVFLLPAPLQAHGALRQARPGEGAHLSEAPRELRLTFSEAVELAFARLSLTGPHGVVKLTPLARAADTPTVLVAEISGPLSAGTYTVTWQVAGADGHPVRGQYSFVIAPGAAGLVPAALGPVVPGRAAPPPTHHEATSLPSGSGFDAESPLYAAIRWVTFLGLLGVIGAVAFRLVLALAQRQQPGVVAAFRDAAARNAAGFGLAATVLLAAAALLRLYAQSYALHGAGQALQPALIGTMLSRTVWGWGWVLQAAATAAVAVGFSLARRRTGTAVVARAVAGAETVEAADARTGTDDAAAGARPRLAPESFPAGPGEPEPAPGIAIATVPGPAMPEETTPNDVRRGWGLAALGAVLLAATPALSGHAASTTRFAPLPVLADALHVLGAGGWLGSLLVLLVVGIPAALRLPRRDQGTAVASLVNAFSPTALVFAGVVVATGVFAAWLHLGSVPALWQSGYGRTLLLKLGVLSVVFGTGAYNWLRVKPALGEVAAAGRLRRSAALELVVGAVVLAVTAVLVATATPAGTGM